MTGPQRNRCAAVGVFLLIAAGVVGGMTWATSATLQLARRNALDEHRVSLRQAVQRLDSNMSAILGSETARSYTHYRSSYWVEGVAYSRDKVELDATIRVQSPLTKGPPHNWIDLYFVVDPNGGLSSPQVPGEGMFPFPDNMRTVAGCDPRVCRTWSWFKKILPELDLAGHTIRDPFVPRRVDRHVSRASSSSGVEAKRLSKLRDGGSELQRRRARHQHEQSRYVPDPQCVAPEIADRNIHTGSACGEEPFEIPEGEAPDAEVQTGEFGVPFWLESAPRGEPKLAFVRACRHDEAEFFQGFVVDWGRLRTTLLEKIAELFPTADLIPVNDNADLDVQLATLPVQLSVPVDPASFDRAAWQAVRGTLVISWLATAIVLLIAGYGLYSFSSLMNRRMQFAYAVTHELRTPLTTFRLYSDMLSAGLVPDESKQRYLDTLNREALRLTNLVEDVLEYARLGNHRVRLNPIDTDGAGLLQVISETLVKRCEENGIEPRTANAINGQRLHTDVDVVNRIATVLVNNACRHARGRDGAAVLVQLANENGEVHLDVIDTGPGIDRSDARNIFKPFRRGQRAEAVAQGGVGLGLALARTWAGLLGGRLDLVDRHDPEYGGAHFRLSLPRQIAVKP